MALFTEWDYDAFVTDRESELIELEADLRRPAVVRAVDRRTEISWFGSRTIWPFFANAP